MKHLITMHEGGVKDVIVETGIDDPAESERKAFEIATDLYESGTIDLSLYGSFHCEGGDVVTDDDLRDMSYVDVYDEEGEIIS